jgi:hypothetical protein
VETESEWGDCPRVFSPYEAPLTGSEVFIRVSAHLGGGPFSCERLHGNEMFRGRRSSAV